MNTDPSIPKVIFDRILAFIQGGHTGQISLNIHKGEIKNAEVKEKVLPDDGRPALESRKN
jgi:hypothetical protein